MGSIIRLASNMAMLRSRGVVVLAVGSEKVVAKLFSRVSKDVVLETGSAFDDVKRSLNAYVRQSWKRLRAYVVPGDTYFNNPGRSSTSPPSWFSSSSRPLCRLSTLRWSSAGVTQTA
ncbi:hypothetical protein ACP70R_008243 [Stipagrostis hirtigluma subsp. patula]